MDEVAVSVPTAFEAAPTVEAFLDAPAEVTEPTEPAPAPVKDSMAAKFAALARKERDALAIKQEADTLKAKYVKAEEAIGKKDAIAALEAMGLDFDEALAEYIKRQTPVEEVDPRDAKIAALEAKEEAREKQRLEAEAAAQQSRATDATKHVVGDIQKLIDAAPEFDRVSRIEGSAAEIYEALNIRWAAEGGKSDPVKFIQTNFKEAARILEDHYEAEYRRYAPRSVTASETDSDVGSTAIEDSRQPRTLTNSTISGQTRPVVERAMSPDEALEMVLAELKR